MPLSPIPVDRYLVPPVQPSLPEGFTAVSQALTSGLPYTITLNDDLTLMLIVPNGLAHTWRDGDPSQVISDSGPELAARTAAPSEPIGSAARAPARLLLRRTGTTLAVVPLVAGLHRLLPDAADATAGVAVELVILSWQLHAGILRGPGDFGSRIDLAWRTAGEGTNFYSELPEIPPFLYRLRDIAIVPSLFPRTLLHEQFRTRILKSTLVRSKNVRSRF